MRRFRPTRWERDSAPDAAQGHCRAPLLEHRVDAASDGLSVGWVATRLEEDGTRPWS
jgi:hypothetical protein